MSDSTPPPDGAPENGAPPDGPQAFTQDDVNKLIGQTRAEERRKAAEKFADYDDLKARAGQSQTLEERLATIEADNQKMRTESIRLRIAAKHGISTEPAKPGEQSDADLFLTGTDEATMTRQAQRLAEQVADRKKGGNVAPREGGSADNPRGGTSDMRDFARNLFGDATT